MKSAAIILACAIVLAMPDAAVYAVLAWAAAHWWLFSGAGVIWAVVAFHQAHLGIKRESIAIETADEIDAAHERLAWVFQERGR